MDRESDEEEATECAGDGASCKQSKCCKMAGMQCYEKNKDWGTCRPDCVPGPNLADADGEHWSCKPLGKRTPGHIPQFEYEVAEWVKEQCTGPGENCIKTQCCKEPGMQCFVKHDTWASCKPSCVPGPDLYDKTNESWNCTGLGPRTPGVHEPVLQPVAEWVKTDCSGPNEDCRSTKCCSNPNVQCYEKNKAWAACKPSCEPGPDKYDVNDEPWSCDKLGSEWTVTTTTTTTIGFPSLFCFSVTRSFGDEAELIRFQHKNRAGIFACDETAILCTDPFTVGEDGDLVSALWFNNAPVGRSKDGTAGNTLLFLHAWDSLNKDGRWQNFDWTIKADPDAVIFPQRMRDHLKPHNSRNVFMRNCNLVPDSPDYPMMFGALEALSKGAITTYFQNKGKCDSSLDWSKLGEDLYLQRCLLFLGVEGAADMELIGDSLCGVPATCKDANHAGYHPFKTPESWRWCWGTAMGKW